MIGRVGLLRGPTGANESNRGNKRVNPPRRACFHDSARSRASLRDARRIVSPDLLISCWLLGEYERSPLAQPADRAA